MANVPCCQCAGHFSCGQACPACWRSCCAGKHKELSPTHQPLQDDRPVTQPQIARHCARLSDARTEVACSAFLRGLSTVLQQATLALPAGPRPLLGSVSRVVMWGLGSLESPLVHIRYQLALLQLLQDMLQGPLQTCPSSSTSDDQTQLQEPRPPPEGSSPLPPSAAICRVGSSGSSTSGGHSSPPGVQEVGPAVKAPQARVWVEAFDPVFTPLDRAVLGACGIQVRAAVQRTVLLAKSRSQHVSAHGVPSVSQG